MESRQFFHSLRFKLLLVSLTLLGIPWSGYYLVAEMEELLETQQKESLVAQASIVQQVLLASPFDYRSHRRTDLFVHSWGSGIAIDGYDDDWILLEKHAHRVTDPKSDFAFEVAVGQSQGRFVLLIDVTTTPIEQSNGRDSVVVAIGSSRYEFKVDTPGFVRPKIWDESLEMFMDDISTVRFKAAWQPTANGYRLEASWPQYLVKPNFGVRVHTTGNRKLRTRYPIESGRLIQPVPTFEALAEKFAHNKMRIRIFDYQGWRIADVNRMNDPDREESALPWILQKLLRFSLSDTKLLPYLFDHSATKMPFEQVNYDQNTSYHFMRRKSDLQDKVIAIVAMPLIRKIDGAEVNSGTIYVEQSTDDILYMQDKALQKVVFITVSLFVITAAALLVFAKVLTSNIRKLKADLDKNVSHDGRITGQMRPSAALDELGDLSRGISSVLRRLTEYNQYLEAMASRLAHELRTPLTVVKTSVDNAKLYANDDQLKYLDRAVLGVNRLDDILKRLREASRLEQSLQEAEIISFSFKDLVERQIEGYRGVWPDCSFNVQVVGNVESIIGAPDAIVQAFEKLIGNAIDFHQAGTPIVIKLAREKKDYHLSVINQGPQLPEEDIFASMVSSRKASNDQPHLGLGLYIVRLVADFHRGYAFAINVSDNQVEVGFTLKG